jgi:hypothetical protein
MSADLTMKVGTSVLFLGLLGEAIKSLAINIKNPEDITKPDERQTAKDTVRISEKFLHLAGYAAGSILLFSGLSSDDNSAAIQIGLGMLGLLVAMSKDTKEQCSKTIPFLPDSAIISAVAAAVCVGLLVNRGFDKMILAVTLFVVPFMIREVATRADGNYYMGLNLTSTIGSFLAAGVALYAAKTDMGKLFAVIMLSHALKDLNSFVNDAVRKENAEAIPKIDLGFSIAGLASLVLLPLLPRVKKALLGAGAYEQSYEPSWTESSWRAPQSTVSSRAPQSTVSSTVSSFFNY